jgi:UDP-N-acetylglucosamine--N-acetylmuramyl-(pentapeptide) pyrophosphoryl-undecaprenol N-acetylglucosamine transferase
MNLQITKQKKLMIMAAGTGGHIFPGIAIAQLMQERGWSVTWLGTKIGMEADIVPKHYIHIDQLDFTGLRGKGLKHTILGSVKLIFSFIKSIQIIVKEKPDVVLGMGGYVTVPGGIAAKLCGKSLALMNADAPILLSNKVLKPFANILIFGLPSLNSYSSKKYIFTGNPIRKEICNLETPTERYGQRLGKLKVLVVGGSLGAKALNDCVPAALALLPEEDRPIVTHQSGKLHVETLRQTYIKNKVEADVVDFIDDMSHQYKEIDLLICRAGAITISELTAAGVASILVPLVASSTSHQKANAEWLSEQGAAIYLKQSEMNAAKLAELIKSMNREKCLQLAEAAYQLGRRQASEDIAQILEKLV